MNENYILHKYLNGEASPKEIEILRSTPEYADYFKIAEAARGFQPPEFSSVGNFEVIQQNKVKHIATPALSGFNRVIRIAAVMVLIVVSYVFISSLSSTVRTDIAQKETFKLPDGSEVQLNANSEIKYKKRNWENHRSLSLAGEAYFKVTKGNTFEVETPQGSVTVLGTQFNVFSRDTIFNIKCFEGLVSVAFNDTLIKLPAGNKLKVENNKLVVLTSTNSIEPAWIRNESNFENASLATVLKELEAQYPITITSPKSIANKRFTGSFTHNDLELALKSICDPLRIGYTLDDNEVTLYAK
ncbi:MAG: FecR family protein [Bacteroidia bacterium]|nr:FecR family protein [Bacteroidia bacterium]NNF31096.1 FecR family protein [Flavobacteriaceae bacterium]NNJ81033.1 FecR family protein [Flavobacteriaceae bacterium]NNK55558.1 FecR family protein [Flavobacteriaceae bacterium]NNM08848.1 FecR family protein [Flavobacteriaceae bacterium]